MKRILSLCLALSGVCSANEPVPVTDFLLSDVNLSSVRRRDTAAELSPRQYRHQITAWYFANEPCTVCQEMFTILSEIYDELKGTTALPVEIIGVNMPGNGTAFTMFAGKPLSWVRDNTAAAVTANWGAQFRDVIILDPLNRKIDLYNVVTNPLTVTANRNEMRRRLRDAANQQADTDGDKLPDYWEILTYGDLTRTGASVEANGITVLQRYAHCGGVPDAMMPTGFPRLVALPDGSVSVIYTRRRGLLGGLTVMPEFSRNLTTWETAGHGWEDWSTHTLYDGSGGELVEWKILSPGEWRYVRIRGTMPGQG